MAYWRGRISFYLYHLAIFDMGDDIAAPMATAAGGPNLLYLTHYYLLFGCFKRGTDNVAGHLDLSGHVLSYGPDLPETNRPALPGGAF
jgi:hypothetical protein